MAVAKAAEAHLDLIEIAPTAKPPVCKILDFGKYKYEISKKEKDSKKKQHVIQVKEVRFRPKTERHDFEFKIKNARKFLIQGNKVKITVMFRGRELEHKEFGYQLLKKITDDLSDIAKIDAEPKKEGRNIVTVLFRK